MTFSSFPSTCDQCNATCNDRCPSCKLHVCEDCFLNDHVFCHGPYDPWLGAFRALAVVRSKEADAGEIQTPHKCIRCRTGEGEHSDRGYCAPLVE
jgi:hypothetical protein